jgi:uncharacterized membrane protein
MPEIWAAGGNLMLLMWTGREAVHLGQALEGVNGRWAHPRDLAAPRGAQRLNTLTASVMGLLWMVQSAALLAAGLKPRRDFTRACGYIACALAALVTFLGLTMPDGWSSDLLPILHPTGMLALGSVALIAASATGLARRRELFSENERWTPEVLTLGATLLLLTWTALEAGHLARAASGLPGVFAPRSGVADRAALMHVTILSATFTSAGWLLQAFTLLVIGWVRHSAFLRWTGLGLTGITVLKFLVADLQTVDVFWRFLTAIVVGAALLAISYAYQRRARA